MQLIEFFDRGVRLNPHGIAFSGPDGSGALTYTEADTLTHRIAAALHRDGLAAQAPVAVLGPNTPALFPCVLGVVRAGCAWVALNAKSTPQDMADLLSLVGARALLVSSELAEAARHIQSTVPTLERVVVMDGRMEGGVSMAEWLAPEGSRVALPPLDPEAIAGYFGTGGTTGRSKAVEVPHRAFETMILAFHAHMPEPDPVHLVAAPLTHAAGTMVFPVLAQGGTNIIHGGVDPAAVLDSIARNRVTRLFLPPTAIYSLLAHPGVGSRSFSSLRYFLYGAAPMSVEKLQEAMNVFGPVMTQFYGQTEVPMLCTFMGPEDHAKAMSDPALLHRLASCGQQSHVTTVAIQNDDGGLCDTGERGEIVVRSSLRMRGYHNNPEQTAAVFLDGDWLATGDVGYMDSDGFVYIVDRKRDLIISGGFNVFPSEVEQVLWSHPAIEDCAVIGVPNDKWGEQVTAVVELKDGATADSAELITYCKERLGSIKAPKELLFRDLPRSSIGKVLKRQLRDEYWQGRDRRV